MSSTPFIATGRLQSQKPFRCVATGFTLLEVLTAMGVFCFAVLGLLYALNTTLDAAGTTRRQQEIRQQLENRLARLSLPPLKEYSQKSELEGIRYTEEIRPESIKTRDLNLLAGYWRVRVEAEWSESGKLQKWEASHLVWNP